MENPLRKVDLAKHAAAGAKASGIANKDRPRDLKCPASHEMNYDDDELEFLRAIDAFKSRTHRAFPLLSDYLAILKSLGYAKPPRID